MVYFMLANLLFLQNVVVSLASENVDTEAIKPYMLPIPPNNHGIQPTVLIDKETKLLRNNLLTTIPKLSTEWSVTFNVRVVKFPTAGSYNVIRFTNEPLKNHENHGNRVPCVNLSPSTEIYISSSVSGNKYYSLHTSASNLNQTYSFEINQRYISNGEYRFYVVVDGVEIHSTVNTDARQFYNVEAYASDRLHGAADAYISSLTYVNFL